MQTTPCESRETYRYDGALREVLGRRDGAENPVGLLDARAQIRKYTSGASNIYSVTFPETLLYGAEFIKLLTSVKSGKNRKYYQGYDEILNDWEMPDHLEREENRRLIRLHQGLGTIWSEFERYHRRKFINAARPSMEEDAEKLFEWVAARIVTSQQAVAELPELIGNYRQISRFIWGEFENLKSAIHTVKSDITRDRFKRMRSRNKI